MDIDEMKSVARRFYEEYDRNDRQALARLLAPDCVVHLPGVPGPLDRDGFLRVSEQFAGAFSDSRTTFEAEIAEGDTTVVRWLWEMTHVRALWDIPPTRRRVAVRGVTINRVVDGVIVEQWVSFDRLGLLKQLVDVS